MSKVRNQEHQRHGAPHTQVPRRTQHERLVEGEEQVHVCQLGHCHRGGQRDNERGCAMEELQVALLAKVRVVGADEGGDGLEMEEEEAVCQGQAEELAAALAP